MLHDSRVKRGESGKLKASYTGPFVITRCEPNFNYRLQNEQTGKDLRRAVHANRLRLLKVHSNDYRLPQLMPLTQATTGEYNGYRWKISVGETLAAQADVLVHITDELFTFLSDSRDRLTSLAGSDFYADCEKVRLARQPLVLGDTFLTRAGGSLPQSRVLHVVVPTSTSLTSLDSSQVSLIYGNCLARCPTDNT